jgi:guanine deaminase
MAHSAAIRGSFSHWVDNPWSLGSEEAAGARLISDRPMLIDSGIITTLAPHDTLRDKLSDYRLEHIKDKLILPGFIDGHIHFLQARVTGSHGSQLLD